MRVLVVWPADRVLGLPHGTRARAVGIFEILQRPPTRSGRPVWFPLVEDESGPLQATVFEKTYRRYGHVLHHEPAYLFEGRVEQDARRGLSFVADRISPLSEALAPHGAGKARTPSRAPSHGDSTSRRAASS